MDVISKIEYFHVVLLDLHSRFRKFWLISREKIGQVISRMGRGLELREAGESKRKWQFEIGGKLRQVCQQEWDVDTNFELCIETSNYLMAAFDGWCDFHFRVKLGRSQSSGLRD